jgi:V/A-type H+-transporting ATPase subunit I
MSRLTAAGRLSKVDEAVSALAELKAVHLLDYPGDEEGFDLGSPTDESEEIGRDLNRYRSASSQLAISVPKVLLESEPIRNKLVGELPSLVELMLEHSERIEAIATELSNIDGECASLSLLQPLGLDIDLLSGYESLTVFVGTVTDADGASAAAPGGLAVVEGVKPTVAAVFCENDDARSVQSSLEDAGYAVISVPEGEGSVDERLEVLSAQQAGLEGEQSELQNELDGWADANGATLLGGIELLERDMTLALGPIRVAVSDHAFVMDGWVETSRSNEVREALSQTCQVVDIEPFKVTPGGGGHGHHGPELQLPPIKFADRHKSKPMELLTDLMGRPRYGKVDPTLFMFFTYPLFFGLILGDIVYGAATMGFAYFLYKKIGHSETGMLASKFIAYIGGATVVFGYIYGEFAGFEILPHAFHEFHSAAQCSAAAIAADTHYNWVNGSCWGASHAPSWATMVTGAYPYAGQIHLTTADLTIFSFAGVTGLPFGMELAFPFHRVVPVSAGGNLESLILLTIYMGVVHVLLGLVIGFRDIWVHGDSHGNTGPVVAFFDRGSWIIILVGGFMFGYGFLTLGAGQTSAGYIEFLTSMRNIGALMALVGMLMLIYASWKYHGLPFGIGALLGPIEAIGMMPTVISYVRLFAVGMAGVKIAETGNDMLYGTTPDPGHDVAGAGMLDAVYSLGEVGVAGLLLFVAVAPLLAAIAIKIFSKRLPVEAGKFGFLHGMTLSGIIGMVLAGVEIQTVLMVLSPLVLIPALLQGLGAMGWLNTTMQTKVKSAMLLTWLTGLILVGGVYLVVTLALAWVGLQFFAWGLGLASPNIHTARLHLVEWMKQFYEAVGEAFQPFGFTPKAVEVE